MNTPKIAMGVWAWGDAGKYGNVFGNRMEQDDFKPVFDAAMKNGFNLWDTAAVYAMGASEEILGAFIKNIKREDILISTKFTPQIANTNVPPETAAQEMFNGSKKRLNIENADIYWIHNPADVERWTSAVIPLAKSGQIKSIGVSNHNLAELKRAAEILGAADLKISGVQNHFSLLNRSSEKSGILDYCKENGITFYAYMVLEQGALSGKYDTSHPFPEGSERAQVYNGRLGQLENVISALKDVGEKHGMNIPQTATAWAIAKGTLPIIGVTKVSHVEDAAKAAEAALTTDEIAYLERTADTIAANVIRYWEKEMA